MNRRPLSVDLGLLESLDSLSEPMADTARKITAESLHARLPVENPHDEFGRLAGVFNETLCATCEPGRRALRPTRAVWRRADRATGVPLASDDGSPGGLRDSLPRPEATIPPCP